MVKRTKKEDVFFTGHSLGGALATLTPLVDGIQSLHTLYTYGSPRGVSESLLNHSCQVIDIDLEIIMT